LAAFAAPIGDPFRFSKQSHKMNSPKFAVAIIAR
jgi:hypothetical protein